MFRWYSDVQVNCGLDLDPLKSACRWAGCSQSARESCLSSGLLTDGYCRNARG